MKNMFLEDKAVSIIIALFESKKPLYISEVAKKTDCMYPHALGVLKKFEEMGFVTSRKEGRTRYFTLTASGKKIGSSLRKTQNVIKREMTSKKRWQKYEDVTKQVLNDVRDYLGISRIEGKQKIRGKKSGTKWEVDLIAYDLADEKLILIECRQRSKSKIPKGSLGGFAYIIKDTGADQGIIVTTIGLQKGAKKVAKANKITEMILDYNSTSENYITKITNKIFAKRTQKIGVSTSLKAELKDLNGNLKEIQEY